MYIDVLIREARSRTKDSFTYYSDKALKPGTLVAVTFGKKQTQGIVLSSKMVSSVQNVLPVLKILSATPLLIPNQLRLLTGLQNYYQCSLSQFLSLCLPQFTSASLATLSHVPNLAKHRQTLIIVPTTTKLTQVAASLRQRHSALVLYHGDLSPGDRALAYLNILQTCPTTILATRVGLFLPFANLHKIVVIDEHDWSYKENRTPKYHAMDVAVGLAKVTGATIEVRDAAPRVETWYRSTQLLARQPPLKLTMRPNKPTVRTILLNLAQEKRAGNYNLLSEELATLLHKALKQGMPSLLYLNKKNDGGTVYCANCTATSYVLAKPVVCPGCQSDRVRYSVVNIKQVAAEINKLLILWGIPPGIWHTDKKGSLIALELKGKKRIIVGTQKVLYTTFDPQFGVIGVILADTLLDLPEFRACEKTYATLSQLILLARPKAYFVIQTKQPEHSIFHYFATSDYTGFASNELTDRKKMAYPPFGLIVLLTTEAKTPKTAMRNAEKLFQLLESITVGQKADITGPFTRLHKLNQVRLLLKTTNRAILSPYLAAVPTNWQIDFNPENIVT